MEQQYGLWILFLAYISYYDAKVDSRVKQVFDTYDFQGEVGLLQFWECSTHGDSDYNGCYLLLTDQFCVSNVSDNRIDNYRRRCLDDNYRFVGRETNVGRWLAGRAAQTGVADYQHDGEASGMGQLVVPVYFNHPGAGMKLAGIIELVTAQHKESYVADFDQIQNLLMMVNLISTHMGKTIKVQYKHMVKFTLPFSAKLPDLQMQVTMRFTELENKTFCITYEDANHNHHSILSDQDLEFCISESISKRTTVIRMFVQNVVV